MGWKELIAAIVRLIEKFGGSIAAFFIGRKSGADAVKDKAAKEADQAEEDQDEKDQKFEFDRRDPDKRQRVRDAIGKANGRSD